MPVRRLLLLGVVALEGCGQIGEEDKAALLAEVDAADAAMVEGHSGVGSHEEK